MSRPRIAALLLPLGLCALLGGRAEAAGRCDGGRLARAPAGLPAPVTITTRCGRFRIGPDGRVTLVRRRPDPLPVSKGAFAWYMDGTWYGLERGHLVVGRRHRRLWRSQGRFPKGYQVGTVVVGETTLAFSYDDSLFVADLGSAEREVGAREYPIGWTRAGDLFTGSTRGGELRLRRATGALAGTLARGVYHYAFDRANGELYFLDNGRVVRTEGSATFTVGDLARLGLSRRPELDPLGRLFALRDQRRLVALRRDGSLFASTGLPARHSRIDGVSSPLVAAPDGRSIAFTATQGNTAYGSRGFETVYLLRAGARRAETIHRERMQFAVCERGAELAWHGGWLLYSASEGNLVAVDGSGRHRALDLTRTVLGLPGTTTDEGNVDSSARWGGKSPA